MMYAFLADNREGLIESCKRKVLVRPYREASELQLSQGIPMFLDQLIRTLHAEEEGREADGLAISGRRAGDGAGLSEMGVSATAHGANLLDLGYTVDQVVHDYGDLCQAITDLAFERDAPFAILEFRTLNRCLDNAIADAVLEFTSQHDARFLKLHTSEANERIGFLVHELRNALSTATMSVSALEFGNLNISGSTGAVLKRSLASLGVLIDRAVNEVRQGAAPDREVFSIAAFVPDAEIAARLQADLADCTLTVRPLLQSLFVRGNRAMLQAALANLLQNAFKFTAAHTEITLHAFRSDDNVLIEVHDHCGGLSHGAAENLFAPFVQRNGDKSGLGLGLAIARHSVEADSGTLGVRDVPGLGCVFTITLPCN